MEAEKSKIVDTLIEHILHETEENKTQWIEALSKLNSGGSKSLEMNYYKNIDNDIFTMIKSTTEIVERFVLETDPIINGGIKKSQKLFSYLKLFIALVVLLAAGFAVGYFFYPSIDHILDMLLFSKKF